jgi:hypothetical protein
MDLSIEPRGCLFWFALVIGTATFIAAISIAVIGGL